MDKEKILQYSLLYFQNDEPCPYTLKCGYSLNIYPIKVKDWSIFESSLDILQIDKNAINSMEIIKMSYLEFLATKMLINEDGTNNDINNAKLYNIFDYSLDEKNITVLKHNNKYCVVILDNDENVKGYITPKEFDEISKIILYQNIFKYDDRVVSSDVKNLMEDYYRIKYKDAKTPTLEEEKTYVLSKTGLKMNEINDMTYRTFSQIYKHCIDDVIFIGQKIIQGSFKYDIKEDITHPLYTPDKDIYAEIFEDTSTLSAKGISGAEQLNGLNIQ